MQKMNTFSRREFLRKTWMIGGTIILGSSISGCIQSSRPKVELPAILYGGQENEVDMVWISKDFYSKYDIKVDTTIFPSGGDAREILVAGKMDIAQGGVTRIIGLIAQLPTEARILYTHFAGGDRQALIVRKDSAYQSLSDLKGKNIGTPIGSGTHESLLQWIRMGGLSEKDFQWTNIQVTQVPAALEAGRIDAGALWEPTVSVALVKGFARVIKRFGDITTSPNTVVSLLDKINSKRESFIRFIAAQIDMAEFIKTYPSEAATLVSKKQSEKGILMDVAVYKKVLEVYDPYKGLKPEYIDEMQKTAQFMYEQGKIKVLPKISDAVDSTLYRDAVKMHIGKSDIHKEAKWHAH